jgi:hypothetical protein
VVGLGPGADYRISYVGGDGNDVVLVRTQSPPPPFQLPLPSGGRHVVSVTPVGGPSNGPPPPDQTVMVGYGFGSLGDGVTVEVTGDSGSPTGSLGQEATGDITFTVAESALYTLAFDFRVVTFQFRRGAEVGQPGQIAFYNPDGSFDPYAFLAGG